LCRLGTVIAFCALAAGCGRVPPPPYPLSFSLDGRSPRLLVSSEEVTVPVTIANTGSRAWDPERIHLSYHWLWFIPRETASRSRWNIPFHDGIRSDLGAPVAAGRSARIEGRVLAPAVPGLYWLQWDMVEEGVGWFAQVAPRQPRALVVVLPPLVWVLLPLPLLIALAGLKACATSTRTVGAQGCNPAFDIVWCAAVLFAKPFLLIRDALLEPAAAAYWLILVVAVLLPTIAAVLLPRRVRAWTLLAIGIVASLLILADVVYYRFFGDVLSAPALLGAHQTGHVWGSIRSLLTPGLLWLIADWPFAVWLTTRLSRMRTPDASRRRGVEAFAIVAALAAVGIAVGAPRALAAAPLDQMFRNRAVVEQLGPFGYHAYDAWNYARTTWARPAISEAAVQDAAAWFANRAPLRRAEGSPFFGAARGRNLIVVQVESLQDFAVDYTIDGQPVMPHLRAWAADGIRFTNVTDQTSEGRTSDAEFTTMASLLPLDHGAAAFRYPANHYVALPRVLHEHGYATLSAVAFEPGFWNRGVMHPSYGFERSLFEPDFRMTEQIGWGLNDRDFLQQMVPRLEQLPQPFAAWMITLSLHHPFEDFPAAHKTLKLGRLDGTSFGNYLHTMRFFDQALEDLKQSLARDGLLERSVLVVFGDHDAGFARDTDEVSWALRDRVPWLIRIPSAGPPRADGASASRATPAGQTDFAPTLLGLLGIDAGPLPYVGRNLLGAPDDPPVVRPYGDWVDARHLFLTRGADHLCVDLERRAPEAVDRCAPADEAARRAHDVSRLVVTADLQQRIAERLR
jgi:phosphoglycerol transferase MdoB-like AlkP superfamily enzyme